ncbi:MAG: hypothetical protein IT314_04965 [Anaerolineales bacterium]|nr:hypothetical protein [Anaerolineales bacterium]
MANKKKQKASQQRADRRNWGLWGIVLVLVVGVVGYVMYSINTSEQKLAPGMGLGGVTYCQAVPKFAEEMGYDTNAIMSTNETLKGLFIYDRPLQVGQPPTNVYQHPTWDDAGYLGTPVNDGLGNIYVAPAPRVNLYDNPPEQQNTIYKVDTDTGELAEYIRLPFAAPMPPDNPFGIIGMTYDCDTNSLYAASVYGSSKDAEVGIIYQIDLDTGKVTSQLNDIDAFGLGVFNRVLGKRLYFGLTRKSEVWSVALGSDGRMRGKPRFEFSMAGWGADGDDKARRILFRRSDEMFVRGSAFNYNLIAGSERVQTDYQLRYDAEQDIWLRVEDEQ